MEGKFVRASYNNEGYVILGYQASNRRSARMDAPRGRHDVRDNVPDYNLTRERLSLETPMARRFP